MSDKQITPAAPQTPATQRKSIQEFLVGHKSQFAMALPSFVTPDRFMRIALTALSKTPKLAECTRESLMICLLDCARLGIEPDGRRAHLIPYKDECTLVVDYKGLAELVRRSGEVSDLHADIVCENDFFEYHFGSGAFLKHKIDLRKPRGAMYAAYSFVRLKDGTDSFDVMPLEEINAIRDKSQGYQYAKKNNRQDSPWLAYPHEMEKKTVFRRHSKWLPLSAEMREKIDLTDEPLTDEDRRFAQARTVPGATVEPLTFGDAPPPAPETPPAPAAPAAPERIPPLKPRGRKEQKPPPTPTKAEIEKEKKAVTRLSVVRALMDKAQIEEGALMVFLFGQLLVQQGEKLDKLSQEKLQIIIDDWDFVAKAIGKEIEEFERQPYENEPSSRTFQEPPDSLFT